MRNVKLFLVLSCFVANLSVCFANSDLKNVAHKEAVEILNSEGIEAAVRYLDDYLKVSQDDKTIYLIAWTEFLRRNYRDAEYMAKHLENNTTKPEVLAAVYYLLGYIYNDDGDPETKSVSHLEAALKIYLELDQYAGAYRCYLALATSALEQGNLRLAERYQVLALRLGVLHQLDLSLYHSFSHQIELSLGNYQKARQHLLKELKQRKEQGNQVKVYEVQLHLATLDLLDGDLEAAVELNQPALVYFQEINDPIRIAHGQLNAHFINGCGSNDNLLVDDNPVARSSFLKKFPSYIDDMFKLLSRKLCD